jgi:hypothetical protein
MTRPGPSSRALIKTCAYVFVAISVIGGAFVTATTLTLGENENAIGGIKDTLRGK